MNFLKKSTAYCFFAFLIFGLFQFQLNAEENLEGDQDTTEIQQAIEKYQSNISQLELEHGVYHPGIGENLQSISAALRSLNQYDAAHEYLQRALQNHRINYGLHSKEQIPIVQSLIDINQDRKNWQALNKNYTYLDWLYRRVYGHGSVELIEPLETLAQAKLNLYHNLDGQVGLEQLTSTEILFKKVLELSEGKKAYLQNKLNALYGISLANYQVATFISNTRDTLDVRDVRKTNSNYEEALRHDFIFTRAYRDGRNAMLTIIEEHKNNPELSKASHVQALTYLGDWYLLFNKKITAQKTYAEASALLADIDSNDTGAKTLFTKPVLLPEFTMPFIDEPEIINNDDEYFVTVAMNITASGKAKNIEILDTNLNNNNRLKRDIKRILGTARFRPRFENGNAVLTEKIKVKYIYPQPNFAQKNDS